MLRQVESVVDTIAFGLIDTLEATASLQVKADADNLHGSLEVAINAYEGVSVNTGRKLLRQRAVAVAA